MKPAIEPPEIVNKRRLGGVVSRPHAAIDKPSVDFRGSPPFFPVLCHAMPKTGATSMMRDAPRSPP
jgi:hypothetical protein